MVEQRPTSDDAQGRQRNHVGAHGHDQQVPGDLTDVLHTFTVITTTTTRHTASAGMYSLTFRVHVS